MQTKEQSEKWHKEYYDKNKEKIKEYYNIYNKEYRKKNKIKLDKYAAKYRKENKDKEKERQLIYYYGITLEEYNILFLEQEGCCAICCRHQSELKQSLCVDHNHETNEIRGLLCKRCNSLIGYSNDDINILNKAIEFLTKIKR